MADPARGFFDSLSKYSDLEELLVRGEAEGLYLECKSPSSPNLTKDLRGNLAKALSGFSNTAGGVILWGISTTKHGHTGLDVLTQLEPLANCQRYAKQVETAAPTLTTPAVTTVESKTILRSRGDQRGVVATYIPKLSGDPVQSNTDNIFYFRSGDSFVVAPYEMIKRLFAATDSPDLHLVFHDGLIKLNEDGAWEIPVILRNDSSAIAEHVKVSVVFRDPSTYESITSLGFMDQSSVNPGLRILIRDVDDVIHRGMNAVTGTLRVKMRIGKRPRRKLPLEVNIYANKMRARTVSVCLQLAKKGFSLLSMNESNLY